MMEEQTGYEELSRISARNSQSSNHSQPGSITHLSTSSVTSHVTDLEETAHIDQQVISYGLDRLAGEERIFMTIFLEIHALCARTGLSIEFIDLQDTDGRARWFLGILELLGIDRSGEQAYTQEDFFRGFRRVEDERNQQVEAERKQELEKILKEEKYKYDSDHKDMIEGVICDVSNDNRRSTVIEEERDQFQRRLAQLTGDREIQDSLQQTFIGRQKTWGGR